MAKKAEIKQLEKLLEITSTFGEDGEMHYKAEQGTYTQGVADCIHLLKHLCTLDEVLKS